MREILFRGKRIDTGEWVKGVPFFTYPTNSCKMIQAMALHPDFVDEGDVYYSEGHSVDPTTVGQYTGLKDKNGTKIFEGDKVVYPDSTSYSSYDDYNDGVVDYDEESLQFYFTNRWSVEMEDFDVVDGMMVDVEVIGNIHDNPELLEGER